MRLPGLGPKTARRIWKELGITTVADLQRGGRGGAAPRRSPASAPKLEEQILTALAEEPSRASRCGAARRGLPAVLARRRGAARRIPPRSGLGGGPARRLPRDLPRPRHHRDGDRPARADRLLRALDVGRRGRRARATRRRRSSRTTACASTCASSRPSRYGNLLQHFTGSKDHNVALREDAVRRGLSISEYGVKDVETGEVFTLARRGGALRVPRLPVHPARAAREPRRARRRAQAASCRSSSRSATCAATCTRTRPGRDGKNTLEEMALAAHRARLRVLADHRPLALPPRRPARGAVARDRALNERLAPFRILRGIEVEHPRERRGRRGRRDCSRSSTGSWPRCTRLRQEPDRARPRRDGAPARRLHRPPDGRQDRQAPAGRRRRRARDREGARDGTFLEINSQPDRLDLADVHARARGRGGR